VIKAAFAILLLGKYEDTLLCMI